MVSCPSGVTSPLGVPRFSSATVCGASAVAGPPAAPAGAARQPCRQCQCPPACGTSITASARSAVSRAISAARSSAATISTGRSQRSAQVGAGTEGVGPAARGRQPEPRGAAAASCAPSAAAAAGPAAASTCGVRLVVVRAAQADAEVRQVGVELLVAVAGAVGQRAGCRDALPGQRCHQVRDGAAQRRRSDDLGDADGLQLPRAVCAGERDGGSRADREPFVGRAVQGVGVLGHVGVGWPWRPARSPPPRSGTPAARPARRPGRPPAAGGPGRSSRRHGCGTRSGPRRPTAASPA